MEQAGAVPPVTGVHLGPNCLLPAHSGSLLQLIEASCQPVVCCWRGLGACHLSLARVGGQLPLPGHAGDLIPFGGTH